MMTAKVKGLTSGAMIVGLGLATGCDRVSMGSTWRQVEARQNGLKAKIVIPVAEVRAKKELTPKLDAYWSGQFAIGEARAQDYLVKFDAEGDFESLEVGFDYYFSETHALGLGLGVGIARAKYQVRGRWGKIGLTKADQFWSGPNLNLALVGEIPPVTADNLKLVWRLGYNFTQAHIERSEIDVDLDGWYVGIGLQFDLKN